MIKELVLHNFRKHSHTVLKFCRGVNIITGETGQGKSGIIKALRWLILNKPQGDKIVKRGQAQCSVEIVFDNDTSIKKERNKNSRYILDDKIYSAFGNDLPPDVVDNIQMTDINFQNQFDSHYLLSESSGEIAKQINRCVNLESIDLYISKINSLSKRNLVSIENTKSEIVRIETKLLEYADIDGQENDLAQIQLLKQDIDGLNGEVVDIMKIVKAIESIQSHLSSHISPETLLPLLNDIEKCYQIILDLNQKYNIIVKTVQTIKTMKSIIVNRDNHLKTHCEELRIQMKGLSVCPICETVLNQE